MPVKLEYREEGRLVYWVISDPWSLHELLPLLDEVNQHMADAVRSIYSFVDLREAHFLPKGIVSIHKVGKWNWQPQFGAEVIFVVQSAAVKAVLQLIFRLARSQRAVFFEDYLAAWDYMQQLLNVSRVEVKDNKNKAGLQ